MSDTDENTGRRANGNGAGGAAQGGAPGASVEVRQQYIKDLSFENPLAPRTMSDVKGQPDISIDVHVDARPIAAEAADGGGPFEVVLVLRATAKAADEAIFMAEVIYGGEFLVRNMAQESLQPFLLIEAPRLLFPFARNILADVVRDGGFPPLFLHPIDFVELYRQRVAKREKQGQA